MVFSRRGSPVISGLRGHLAGAGVFVALLACAAAAQWDRKGAQEALEKARALHGELAKSPQPSREGYLQCVEAYRLVYLKDPHYSGSDDAIYEAGQLYELMAEKLQEPQYLSRAARQYRYLLSDYPRSPHCAEAARRLEQLNSASTTKTQRTAPTLADGDAVAPTAAPVAGHRKEIESIRHWSAPDHTRVTIDLDGETTYSATRISDPERVFFDIKNTHVRREWFNKHFIVDDDYLKQIRVAQNRADVVRVVLDFAGATECHVVEMRDPFRIVIELRRGKRVTNNAALATIARRSHEAAPPPTDLETKSAAAAAPGVIPAVETAAAALPESPAGVDLGHSPKSAVLEPVSGPTSPDFGIVTATVATSLPSTTPSAPRQDTPQMSRQPVKVNSGKAVPLKSADVPPPPVSRDPGSPARPSIPTSSGYRTMTRVLGLKIGRIVIDPGHGGHDTGTIGRNGLREKDLVLEIALRLRDLIQDKIGAEVILTRDTDVFVPLEERTAIANARQADLFVSIHANSARNRNTSGVETYFLNFASNAAEREIAARENAASEQNIRDLSDLVRKIAQAEKSAESREFAAILQKALHAGMRQVDPSTRNRGVRRAPFVVLIGAHMPSVLAEVAFISNPRDEKLLRKSESRQHLAQSLFSGVEGYMRTLGSDVAQSRGDSK